VGIELKGKPSWDAGAYHPPHYDVTIKINTFKTVDGKRVHATPTTAIRHYRYYPVENDFWFAVEKGRDDRNAEGTSTSGSRIAALQGKRQSAINRAKRKQGL
jgi:plasmid maintenance system antidote protein VapI